MINTIHILQHKYQANTTSNNLSSPTQAPQTVHKMANTRSKPPAAGQPTHQATGYHTKEYLELEALFAHLDTGQDDDDIPGSEPISSPSSHTEEPQPSQRQQKTAKRKEKRHAAETCTAWFHHSRNPDAQRNKQKRLVRAEERSMGTSRTERWS
jgi:hypothetical protein